ncbi:MAG: acyl CoA:acetate/3-ketoacid CoA transferase [Pelotomaculum sp.]|uniref:Acyl CoA:acetate/3-ketoacid CoA transferase n=2 Tax=Pelotomaculum thermopropionicum TaxID=110500 RepID=A5D1E0_PELTS|nr:acyl CoA:acetate/3-ketoacid CoA transferase [Pelotomaculum sp.]BAE54375.1 propionyl-CoA transferase [Pelotomaculum thermopropionicum]BAF59952.1 acyl CoA:acetate/3-ketoacid CoA transferase [Pelotomaculum thermopropionicum SI]
MAVFMTAEEAAKLIKNGDTVATSGFVGMGHPEEISKAVEKRFLETGEPRDITLAFGASQNDGKSNWGLNRWAKEGLLKKVVSGHWGLQPDLIRMAVENKIEAYNLPQGVMMHLFRAIAGKKPGIITHVGLRTFVDPRETGGRLNDISHEEYVRLIEIDGKEYLFYKAFPINVAIIRGTTADELGNISIEKEGIALEFLALALAAKASGGKVIVQVERVARAGSLHPMMVKVPKVVVDAVVVAKPENHWQVPMGEPYNPSLSGEVKVPLSAVKPLPLNERKVICRRCAMELIPDAVVNLGIGMPEGVGAVAAEESISGNMTMTVEPGVIGGVPLSGVYFGTAVNPEAMVDHPNMFDFYDGGGLDLAVLGMAEMDQYGNVNVSKFGPRIAGAGGFINITQSTGTVVFCGTMTAGGLKLEINDGQLKIVNEGKIKKFVKKVEHITFSGDYGRSSGQKIKYVTERAVFELRPEGVTLTEIAPGVDLERDVLGQMEFKPLIAPDLKLMDPRIFRDAPMGIKEEILAKGRR